MKKILILYTSQNGSTKQYAQWIAEEVSDATCVPVEEYSRDTLIDFDVVIFGSYVKMGEVRLKRFLIEHFSEFSHKEIFMFTVGLVPLESPEGQKSWNAIPAHIRESIICHKKFSGKINYKKMKMFEKFFATLFGKKFHSTFGKSEIRNFVEEVKSSQDDFDVVEVL